MHFALCKEQQHSQKQKFFVVMVKLKLLLVFKPAGLTVSIFLSFFVAFAHLKFPSKTLHLGGCSAVSVARVGESTQASRRGVIICLRWPSLHTSHLLGI
jgi:hypothetical protein